MLSHQDAFSPVARIRLMNASPVCLLADGMRAYFLPPRFYSTEFPYAGLKLKMVGHECAFAGVDASCPLNGSMVYSAK